MSTAYLGAIRLLLASLVVTFSVGVYKLELPRCLQSPWFGVAYLCVFVCVIGVRTTPHTVLTPLLLGLRVSGTILAPTAASLALQSNLSTRLVVDSYLTLASFLLWMSALVVLLYHGESGESGESSASKASGALKGEEEEAHELRLYL